MLNEVSKENSKKKRHTILTYLSENEIILWQVQQTELYNYLSAFHIPIIGIFEHFHLLKAFSNLMANIHDAQTKQLLNRTEK
jgi:hypothetical protein